MAQRANDPLWRDDCGDDIEQVLIRNDLATFVQVMFGATKPGDQLIWAPYLDLMCSRLQDVAEGRCKRLIITLPPRYMKSFCVSMALPAFVLGRDPSEQILCVSYSQDLAKEFALGSQSIMKSQAYIAAFGHVLAGGRQPLHTLRTQQGGIRRATSIDGVATGVGGNCLIFDDPQKSGETLSDALRRSTNQAYEQTFHSRSNNAETYRIVIVMQRLHEDDFVGHVQGLGEKWDVVNLPAIAEEDQAIPFSTFLGDHVFRRREGEVLHPKRIPLQALMDIRRTVGEAIFATQYQQRPAPAGGGLIKPIWFRRYHPADLPAAFNRVIQSWDTANTIEEWSDYSVCTTWGVKGKHMYLLHVFRARLNYPGLKRAVRQQAQLHEALIVYVEDRASGTQILQELREEGFGKLRPVKPTRDKQTRMVNQTALIENGFVHLPAEAPWLEDYLYELTVFPNGKYDDQVDSTSQALDSANSWTDGRGIAEFYRQESEKQAPTDDEIWVIQIPPDSSGFHYDISGKLHRSQLDGCFHLPQEHAIHALRITGWKLVRKYRGDPEDPQER